MNIAISADQNVATVNEAGPLVFALAFVIVLGGAAVAANIICGWGRVQWFSIDNRNGKMWVQCK